MKHLHPYRSSLTYEERTMLPIDPIYTINMNENQRAWFYAEYQEASKNEVLGVFLAIFLGGLGIHHFYLRRDGLGFLYLLFSWTSVPMFIAWIEAFFMPGRVRRYNILQATHISDQILATSGRSTSRCSACGHFTNPTAMFCNHCGASVTPTSLTTQTA
jgi:TM2 domain-containing membrane protein YozV